MARDERTYIRVHDGMPDHPKIDGLSDSAFRLLVTMWCWCARHHTDGHIPAGTWAKRGTSRARRELAVAGLVKPSDGSVVMHDYLEHQRSAAEIAALREKRRTAGRKGGQSRANGQANANQMLDQVPKQNGGKAQPETDTETERPNGRLPSSPSAPRGAAAPSDINAGTIVAAWVDAFTESTGRKPSASMKAQAGREARQLLETDADPGLVLAAAKAVGSKGLACVEREYAPLVARGRQRAVVADELTPERIEQVLGPDREPYVCPVEVETGPPEQRKAWYRDEGHRRLERRRTEAARVLAGAR